MTVDHRYIEWGKQYSDGCTGVPDFYRFCCYEHDFHYQFGYDIDGKPITRRQADRQFRQCIQANSHFGWWSPMAVWRWMAVRAVGWKYWARGKSNATLRG